MQVCCMQAAALLPLRILACAYHADGSAVGRGARAICAVHITKPTSHRPIARNSQPIYDIPLYSLLSELELTHSHNLKRHRRKIQKPLIRLEIRVSVRCAASKKGRSLMAGWGEEARVPVGSCRGSTGFLDYTTRAGQYATSGP
jgi:hypothetical protein